MTGEKNISYVTCADVASVRAVDFMNLPKGKTTMGRSRSSSATVSSNRHTKLRVHGWLWLCVGSVIFVAALWEGPGNLPTAKLVVLSVGVLDAAAGALLLRAHRGRFLLIPTLAAHLVLAVCLWHNAHVLSASVAGAPSGALSEDDMIERTAGGAMLGMVVLLQQVLGAVSALLSVWTSVALIRSR